MWNSDPFLSACCFPWSGRRRDSRLRSFPFEKLPCDPFSAVRKFLQAKTHRTFHLIPLRRSFPERRIQNCCTPNLSQARIVRLFLFSAAPRLQHLEFVFPATKEGLSSFPGHP